MSRPPDVLWVLDNETDGKTFERLCVDLLGRSGYASIMPVGGAHDRARDAEMTVYRGRTESSSVVFFQFSLEKSWESKLKNEAIKILKYGHSINKLVFVSPRNVTGEKKDKLKAQFTSQYGWELKIYEREWLRFQLEERHPDLAKKYLGVDVPQTPHHLEMILSSSEFHGAGAEELFRNVNPIELKASLLRKIKDGHCDFKSWRVLADVEYHLRNYDEALRAINEALQLATEKVDQLNLEQFKGAILAEQGIKKQSRPLLVQAKQIFEWAAQKMGRSVDHYNLANVLRPLSDLEGAEKHYRISLEKEPGEARTWKNLGSLLDQKGEHEEGMKCFEEAIRLKPDLVEAHLSRGMTYFRALKKPEVAIRCFAEAYQIDPDLDEKWNHVRFWLGEALFSMEKLDEALKLVEIGLRNKPDDVYLMNQKAKLLGKLWRNDTKYEDAALAYFKFRVAAAPNDCWTIIELIDLFEKRGTPDQAWQYLDLNFDCSPYLLSDLGKRMNLSLQDFKEGFRHVMLYQHYRSFMSLEDHFKVLRNDGLLPDRKILPALEVLLMIPFGYTFEQIRGTKGGTDLMKAFEVAWPFMAKIFPAFSTNWMTKSKPSTQNEQIEMVSLALLLLPEIALAEISRHIGFIAGGFGEQLDMAVLTASGKMKEVYPDIAMPWMKIALIDWGLAPDSWRNEQ